MIENTTQISLSKAALVAGLTILMLAFMAPFSELYVYPKLVNLEDASETIRNINDNKTLFISGIFGYLLTFSGDIVVSWALFWLLKPVNGPLSQLAAWFRLVFSVIALASVLKLVAVFKLLTDHEYLVMFGQTQVNAQIMLYLTTFRSGYHFGIFFFSIHLMLLGYLVLMSSYIPNIMGILLVISGIGYLTDFLKPFLFPDFKTGFLTITFFGELIFMLWLLIKGSKIKVG